MALRKRQLSFVLVTFLISAVHCDWIKVPLREHEPLHFDRDIPPRIVDKLESLAVALRAGQQGNHTKQMDLELFPSTSTTEKVPTPTKRATERVVVAKQQVAEPFSIFKLLRNISSSFFGRREVSIKQKVGFLESIRNNILAEISKW